MDVNCQMQDRYGARFHALTDAWQGGQAADFERELDALLRERERSLFFEIGELTRDLNSALERFTCDSRLVDLAEKDVPDARERLAHVLRMTDEAAHRTMDLVDGACPHAERISRAAAAIAPLWQSFRARQIAVADFRGMLEQLDTFVVEARSGADAVRGNLSEVLLAQGYQDLTGQIIRSVMHLVEEVQFVLGNLVRLSGRIGESGRGRTAEEAATLAADSERGFGPAVPGVTQGAVVSGQQDVDSLLSGLGF